jgi:dipeptidyl aminopeptidase/acylaminoacyl peptidase
MSTAAPRPAEAELSGATDPLLDYDRIGAIAPSPDFRRAAVLLERDDSWRLALLELTAPGIPEPVILPDAPAGIDRCVWHPSADRLLVTIDPVGAENHQLAELDATTGAVRWSTDRPDALHTLGTVLDSTCRPYRPDGTLVAYGSNARDPECIDVVVRSAESGAEDTERILLRADDRYFPLAWSPDGSALLVQRLHQNTEQQLFLCCPDSGEVRQLTSTPARYLPAGWAEDGRSIALLTDLGRDLLAPALLEVATGKLRVLADPGADADPARRRDVVSLTVTPDGRHLGWGLVRDGQSHWWTLDLADGTPPRPVRGLPRGVIGLELGLGVALAHPSPDGRRLLARVDRPDRPSEVQLLHTDDAAAPRALTALHGKVPVETLTDAEYVTVPGRDGHLIAAQLFRPPGANERRPAPVVLMLHGGPESAHSPEYAPEIQLLLARGIAVLAPDIRGSSGYGRAFQRATNRDWGAGDVRDVLDCVAFLRTTGWADADRLGVLGGSYGGYLTLACLTQHPELWRAGIELFGPADLVADFAEVPPYWRHRVAGWIGDADDPVDRARLTAVSPIHHLERLTAPLLVVHGVHDVRVSPEQSSRLVARMRELGKEVELILLTDTGHGFATRAHRDRIVSTSIDWLTDRLTA